MKYIYLSIVFSLLLIACQSPKESVVADTSKPPSWAKDVVWYQIFVERFSNGDKANDPTPETMYAASNFIETPDDWSVTDWTSDWYQPEEWAKATGQNFYSNLQLRRYGGDLQGVINKLEHIKALGVTALYFNPINDAPSLHKYDARNFHHIDVNFGPDPEGDRALIAQEDPFNPETWHWTAADKLFLQLVDKAHQLGMRVVVDYSWNCLLYTSDAADDSLRVDLGGRRIIKKIV
jgi:glycosidase